MNNCDCGKTLLEVDNHHEHEDGTEFTLKCGDFPKAKCRYKAEWVETAGPKEEWFYVAIGPSTESPWETQPRYPYTVKGKLEAEIRANDLELAYQTGRNSVLLETASVPVAPVGLDAGKWEKLRAFIPTLKEPVRGMITGGIAKALDEVLAKMDELSKGVGE